MVGISCLLGFTLGDQANPHTYRLLPRTWCSVGCCHPLAVVSQIYLHGALSKSKPLFSDENRSYVYSQCHGTDESRKLTKK